MASSPDMCDCSSLEYTHTQTLVFNVVYREKKRGGTSVSLFVQRFFQSADSRKRHSFDHRQTAVALVARKISQKMKNKGEKGGETEERPKIVRKNIAVSSPPPPFKLSPCVVTFFRELFAAPPEKEFFLGDAATTVPLSHTTCGGGGRIRRDGERIFLSLFVQTPLFLL